MDIVGLFKKIIKYILVFTDHLTRYNKLVLLTDPTFEAVARVLLLKDLMSHNASNKNTQHITLNTDMASELAKREPLKYLN